MPISYQNWYAFDMQSAGNYRTRVYEIAHANSGVITTALAEDHGIPSVALRKLASRGALVRVAQGVYRSPFHQGDSLRRFREAMAAVGPGSVILSTSVLDLIGVKTYLNGPILVGNTKRIRKRLPEGVSLISMPKSIEIQNIKGFDCESPIGVFSKLRTSLAPQQWADLGMELKRLGLTL